MKNLLCSTLVLFLAFSFAPLAQASKEKKGQVTFVTPKDGQTVSRTFKVKFAVKGMKIRPAGEDPTDKTSGHHHLIIDSTSVPAGVPVPANDKHIHYGKGQTETEVTLPPGEHTLTMQFADGLHLSYGDEMSATIKVKVKE